MRLRRKSAPTQDDIIDTAARRLCRMGNDQLGMFTEGHLGETWKSFDELRRHPHGIAADEFVKNVKILLVASNLMRDNQ